MILLAIREFEEIYIDENIFEVIYDVIKKYHIIDNLEYFMMDNVDNNNTALKELNLRIQKDEEIGFDSIKYQF